MGENARFKNGHARVETRVLKTLAHRKMSEASLSIGRERVGAFKKRACRKNSFKHSYTVECRNRLRVGVRAKNASVSGFACRPFLDLSAE